MPSIPPSLAAALACLVVPIVSAVPITLMSQGASAAELDQLTIESPVLKAETPLVVVRPSSMKAETSYPTIYFLHGARGSAEDWLSKTGLSALVDKYSFIAVLPDGGKVGWYLDSPLMPQSQYDSVLASEVVPYVDAHYPTIADRKGRAITGIGMGGHGVFTLAARHPDLFGSICSMNGNMDLKRLPTNNDLIKRLGTFEKNAGAWASNSAVAAVMSSKITPDTALLLSVSANDPTLGENRIMHDVLLAVGQAHSYVEHPSAPLWTYASSKLEETVAFHGRLFAKAEAAALSSPIVPELVTVDSKYLQSPSKLFVFRPRSFDPARRYPVLYLLHGAYDGYDAWYTKSRIASYLATNDDMLVVCPDGNPFGWYLDSPIEPKSQYESYIAKELVPYVDANYPTLAGPEFRALSGLSMGGHGALTLMAKYPSIFGSASSLSGVTDLSLTHVDVDKRLGSFKKFPERYSANSAFYMALENKLPKSNPILISCGTDDGLLYENRILHQALLLRGIPHSYVEHPGKHDWLYWDGHIQEHLLYHSQLFAAALASGK